MYLEVEKTNNKEEKDMSRAEETAKKMIQGLSNTELFDQWELTSKINDENISTVRGWLMDEIEIRFPEAFDKWLDTDAEDGTLRTYCI